MTPPNDLPPANAIAIVALAGRFPHAENVEAFWRNLSAGHESVTFFSDEELQAAGVPAEIMNNPNYVKAAIRLEGNDLFDAAFFGFTPREAQLMDPQQRIFLECAWEALERAGYNPATYPGVIGVFAGASENTYLLFNLVSNLSLLEAFGFDQTLLLNGRDFLATRVSYALNLTGPSVNVQTACSTSLVAVHLACQSLLNGECDVALAGGVSVGVQPMPGYLYQPGGLFSPDGHCRAFDAKAQGTVFGAGAGVVVLKRLEDALAEGDQICAVIRGSSINNDGSTKVGFSAPSVAGQAKVITEALGMAQVDAETVTYIEAHGTGTALGDPVEMAALTQAFRAYTRATGYCALGSVKTNIGHLDIASGVTGLIKTVLALQHKQLPPSLHFTAPNPNIDFANSPFYVNATLSDWKANGSPRRAGVSSFGIGGTNAHVILEEAPLLEPGSDSRPWQLLLLSARTPAALEKARANLIAHLKADSSISLADVAYTLQLGRRAFGVRQALVCRDVEDALQALDPLDPKRVLAGSVTATKPSLVFMFPGGGAQYINMGRELYETEPTFREQVDECAELLKPHLGHDLRDDLYPSSEKEATPLTQTSLALPALFVIEYALARLWMSWGLRPAAMIGHSLGEYTAACLAGVFSLEDALALVVLRGQLFERLPEGAMLSVPLPEAEVCSLLNGQLSIAAVNAPEQCVVSGPVKAIADLEATLTQREVVVRRLPIDVAAHSELVMPILDAFARAVQKLALHPPQIPYVSNVTGTWITASEVTDPTYWAKHLRETVRFGDGLQTVLHTSSPQAILLEVGPGRTLSTLAQSQPKSAGASAGASPALNSLRHPQDQQSDSAYLLNTLGKLWLAGVEVDWAGFYAHEQRRRVLLPTYPFERRRYWVEAGTKVFFTAESADAKRAESLEETTQHALQLNKPGADQSSRPNLATPYVPPQTDLERTLTTLWQQLMGIEPIGRHDNFFELGGHSLLAVKLMTEIGKQTQQQLPLSILFEAPTIEQLAGLIPQQSHQRAFSPLVAIQPNGSQPPLFFVHPGGGTVLCYAALAQHLGPDQPFYAFQARGLVGDDQPYACVEDLATDYLETLRAFRPHGPYALGGWSLGGLVAFEMAQRLLAQGEAVSLLALLDTFVPSAERPVPSEVEILRLMIRDENLPIPYEAFEKLSPEAQLDLAWQLAEQANLLPPDAGQDYLRRYLDVWKANLIAENKYLPQTFPGRITFFRAEVFDATAPGDPQIDPADPARGWGKFSAQPVEVRLVPGTHLTLIEEPHVRGLASALQNCLEVTRLSLEAR
jgi:phthiocerol/phenolphthiocerol synthesis type-I polyketide synthase E